MPQVRHRLLAVAVRDFHRHRRGSLPGNSPRTGRPGTLLRRSPPTAERQADALGLDAQLDLCRLCKIDSTAGLRNSSDEDTNVVVAIRVWIGLTHHQARRAVSPDHTRRNDYAHLGLRGH